MRQCDDKNMDTVRTENERGAHDKYQLPRNPRRSSSKTPTRPSPPIGQPHVTDLDASAACRLGSALVICPQIAASRLNSKKTIRPREPG